MRSRSSSKAIRNRGQDSCFRFLSGHRPRRTPAFIAILIFAILPSSLLANGQSNSLPEHPALAILSYYQDVNGQKEFRVVPYALNLMAMDLLRRSIDPNIVKRYIGWYIAHLNYPDKHGLTGSIYDYVITREGVETTRFTYDSVDAYSATFLLLMQRYYDVTGDAGLVDASKTKLYDMAYTITVLQDKDGLTFALPKFKHKYLMDNCEAFGGLKAFVKLAQKRKWKLQPYYETALLAIARGIEDHLYDTTSGTYRWAAGNTKPSDWNRFYPDAFAQLFPIWHGLPGSVERSPGLWKAFHEHQRLAIEQAPVEQRIVYELTIEALNDRRGPQE